MRVTMIMVENAESERGECSFTVFKTKRRKRTSIEISNRLQRERIDMEREPMEIDKENSQRFMKQLLATMLEMQSNKTIKCRPIKCC